MFQHVSLRVPRSLFLLLVCLAPCVGGGCTQAQLDEMRHSWDQLRPAGSSATEEWTIECNEYTSPNHRHVANELCELLKRVPDLKASQVRVEHEADRSRVFYGSYMLRYGRAEVDRDDQVKGDLTIQLSREIKRDLRYIRQLTWGGQYPFFQARPLPKAVPEEPGNPAWDLHNARGVYTLHIGVTYNTATLHDYKKAAYLWVEDLRRRGYEAYYYHDPVKPQTSICVGTFGEEAMGTIIDPEGVPQTVYNAKVNRFRDQEEEFQYNLENGHICYKQRFDPKTGKRERFPNLSFLVKIPRDNEGLEW